MTRSSIPEFAARCLLSLTQALGKTMKAPALLPPRFAAQLLALSETGMGYQVVTIRTVRGELYTRVVIVGGYIASVDRKEDIPFDPDQIDSIEITHDKTAFVR